MIEFESIELNDGEVPEFPRHFLAPGVDENTLPPSLTLDKDLNVLECKQDFMFIPLVLGEEHLEEGKKKLSSLVPYHRNNTYLHVYKNNKHGLGVLVSQHG